LLTSGRVIASKALRNIIIFNVRLFGALLDFRLRFEIFFFGLSTIISTDADRFRLICDNAPKNRQKTDNWVHDLLHLGKTMKISAVQKLVEMITELTW
jgi:hypothetical protein